MKNEFYVTGLGLTVDKTMIMPGSTLLLNAPAPGAWSRFGTTDRTSAEKWAETHLSVATPAAAVSAEDAPVDLDTLDREGLLGYASKNEITVDGRWAEDKIRETIAAALKAQDDS